MESVYQDGYVYGQHVIPTLKVKPRDDQAQTPPPWGLSRVSHREAGTTEYISQRSLRTFLYCLDTGVRVTHKEFSGRAIWGANFIDKSPVSLHFQAGEYQSPALDRALQVWVLLLLC